MKTSRPFSCPIPSRRVVLVGGVATLVATAARAAKRASIRIGTLPFGTVQWEIKTLLDHHFDTEAGIRVERVPVASSEATRIAFLSGSVDCVVNDILFAARLKAEGKSVVFLPHTTTEGSLVVPAGSAVKSMADLKGKTIGVAGGALDKNWIVLRAAARKAAGIDLSKDARIVYGAPPLLAAKMESGELEAGILYWSQAPRLQAKGFQELLTVEDMLADLGAKRKVAVGGYLFRAEIDTHVLAAFAQAIRRTEDALAQQPKVWEPLRPLMHANDEATFNALKHAYLRGIPRKPRAEEIADAQSLFEILAQIGGPDLVGPAISLPDSLYVDRTVYG